MSERKIVDSSESSTQDVKPYLSPADVSDSASANAKGSGKFATKGIALMVVMAIVCLGGVAFAASLFVVGFGGYRGRPQLIDSIENFGENGRTGRSMDDIRQEEIEREVLESADGAAPNL